MRGNVIPERLVLLCSESLTFYLFFAGEGAVVVMPVNIYFLR